MEVYLDLLPEILYGSRSRPPLTSFDLDFDIRLIYDLDLSLGSHFSSYKPEILHGSRSRLPLTISDLGFDLSQIFDLDVSLNHTSEV